MDDDLHRPSTPASARQRSGPSSGRRRAALHALVLVAAAGLVALGVGLPAHTAAPPVTAASSTVAAGDASPAVAEANAAAPSGDGSSMAAQQEVTAPPGNAPGAAASPTGTASGTTAPAAKGASAQPTPTTRPAVDPAHLPTWLQLTAPAPLMADSAAGANALEQLANGSFVKSLGSVVNGRVLVYYPGDWSNATARQGWLDLASVAPVAGVPPSIMPARDDQAVPGLPPPPTRVSDEAPPQVTSQHVAVIDEASGKVLYAAAEHDRVAEASVTKIATSIVALERAPDLSKEYDTSVSASEMVARDGSSTMGIEPGMKLSLSTMLYGMLLPSGNDAAEQIAVSLGGQRSTYVDWMNQEAAALGLADTHFMNPSGMDQDGHFSSAYDMGMLARYAMRNAEFRKLVGTLDYTVGPFQMHNANRLLGVYPGIDGVKIGYTDNAQRTFVASDTRDGHRVYVSLMHAVDKDTDARLLFDWVWRVYRWPGQPS